MSVNNANIYKRDNYVQRVIREILYNLSFRKRGRELWAVYFDTFAINSVTKRQWDMDNNNTTRHILSRFRLILIITRIFMGLFIKID